MATPSVENPIRTEAESAPREQLRHILELYGRDLCDQPQRCEALLRDLCVGHRREIFLLMAALKERIVPDILASLDVLPEEVIISNLTRKLCENLGLAEHAGRWAAESWVELIRAAPAHGKLKPSSVRSVTLAGQETLPAGDREPNASTLALLKAVDWGWLALCALCIASSALALGLVARVASDQGWTSFLDWLEETGLLAGGLGIAWAGEFLAARYLLRRDPPHSSALDPRRTPAALLVEVLVLLIQPLVPVGVAALWIGEWYGRLRLMGYHHELAFNLGRLLQSVIVGIFVYQWVGLMTAVQGKIASSMVRQR